MALVPMITDKIAALMILTLLIRSTPLSAPRAETFSPSISINAKTPRDPKSSVQCHRLPRRWHLNWANTDRISRHDQFDPPILLAADGNIV